MGQPTGLNFIDAFAQTVGLASVEQPDIVGANCSATTQRGALDWLPRFKQAAMPVFEELYDRVAFGEETRRVISTSSSPDYKVQLSKELETMANSEMWQAGKATRALRPRGQAERILAAAKGTAGRKSI